MPTVSLLVLQPTPFCNIDCTYCYLPDRTSKARMTLETIQKVFSGLVASGWVGDRLDVLWHAGEPLVLPVEYYVQAFRTIESLTPAGPQVQHLMQTNGTLVDDAWCAFFKARNVTVGVSIDGPEALNAHRVTRRGAGTYAQTMRGIRCLQQNGVEFSVITVLTSASLAHAQSLHDFYQDQGIRHVCFNVEEIEGAHKDSSLRPEGRRREFEDFLRAFWNLAVNSGSIYSVREFGHMLDHIVDRPGRVVPNISVEPFAILNVDCAGNYSTFSPELLGQKNDSYGDFIVGNFHAGDLADSLDSEVFKRLRRDVSAGVELCRATCEYFPVCGGGTPVNKLYENGTPASAETMYCRLHIKTVADIAMEIIENSSAAARAGPNRSDDPAPATAVPSA